MSELQDRFKERIRELRKLAVRIIAMRDDALKSQLSDESSNLSEHLRTTLELNILPPNISDYEKSGLLSYIRGKIASLEIERLRLLGISIPKEYLLAAEKFVQDSLSRGLSERDIEQEFLNKGWKKEIINVMLDYAEEEKKSVSTPKDAVERNSFRVSQTILRVNNTREGLEVWKNLLKQYKSIRFREFIRQNGELRLEKNSSYYYTEEDLKKARNDEYSIRTLTAAIRGMLNTGIHIYAHSPQKPLLVEINEIMYIILPYMVSHTCAICGKTLPVNKLIHMELWDRSRTKKIKKFVCKDHEISVWDFLEENKIVQQQ